MARAISKRKIAQAKIWLDNVHCRGTEPGLQFCSSTGVEESTCTFVAYGICTGGSNQEVLCISSTPVKMGEDYTYIYTVY